MVRPTRQGTSLVTDHQGRLLGYKADYFAADEQTLFTALPTRGATTIYPRIGELFAYADAAALAVLIGIAIRHHRGGDSTPPSAPDRSSFAKSQMRSTASVLSAGRQSYISGTGRRTAEPSRPASCSRDSSRFCSWRQWCCVSGYSAATEWISPSRNPHAADEADLVEQIISTLAEVPACCTPNTVTGSLRCTAVASQRSRYHLAAQCYNNPGTGSTSSVGPRVV